MDYRSLEDFIRKLIGTPYIWWMDSNNACWAENSVITDTDIDTVKKYGCNNTGFINLVCRFLDLQIPGLSLGLRCAGGIHVWFDYLNTFGVLEGFRAERNYPEGTLLLREYSNSMDQGHVAIVLSNMRLAHSYPENGICIDESYYISHNWLPEGYYTHVCLPHKWMEGRLLKDY